MDRSVKSLRDQAIIFGNPQKLVNRSNRKQLCEMLRLPTTKEAKYKLTNITTNHVSHWNSVYQLAKVFGIREANFFWRMKTGKPIMIDGIPHKIERIEQEPELETIHEVPEEERLEYLRNNIMNANKDDDETGKSWSPEDYLVKEHEVEDYKKTKSWSPEEYLRSPPKVQRLHRRDEQTIPGDTFEEREQWLRQRYYDMVREHGHPGRMAAPWCNDGDLIRYDRNGDMIGMRD